MSSTCERRAFQAPLDAFLLWGPHLGGCNCPPLPIVSVLTIVRVVGEGVLSINKESDKAASLVIGPTSLGMVRVYVEAEGVELPMDFEPAEALEIANELRAAAEQAIAMAPSASSKQPEDESSNRQDANRGGKRGSKNQGAKKTR